MLDLIERCAHMSQQIDAGRTRAKSIFALVLSRNMRSCHGQDAYPL